jgi:hypothetical protein
MATSRSPQQRFCLSVASTIPAERVQFQIDSPWREHRVHPADGFLVAEVVAYRRNIDQVNPVLLAKAYLCEWP